MTGWIKEAFDTQEAQRIMQKLLERVEVFHGLTPNELALLLENAEKFSFSAGSTILSEGSDGNFLYVILTGSVQVNASVRGGEQAEIAKLSPSDCFGEMSLTDHDGRSANVKAISACTLLRIHERDCWKSPTISAKVFRNIARILSHRLRSMNQAVVWRMD
jgi:CRP/FNR family cyclic AMP-dependent transcriptional regulator